MTTYAKPLRKKIESMKFNILGFPYKVEFVKDLIKRFNITGCASVWGSEIQIDPEISNLDVLSAIFHEIIEVMLRKTETKYEHELVSRFETFLMLLFVDNPELMELALETTKKEGKPLRDRSTKGIKALVKRRKGKSK